MNPDWSAQTTGVAPDGDVFLDDEQVLHFRVPSCTNCSGTLKPEVTFFGDNVKKATVQLVHDRLAESDAVLVTGSSLQVSFRTNIIPLFHFFYSEFQFTDGIIPPIISKVYSGYRFLLAAKERKIPIAILNIGPTRADHLAELKVSARCGEVLSSIQPH